MSYVAIDLKNLRILHRVATMGICSSLVWLECTDDETVMISSMDRGPDWQRFTDAGLVMLYKNTCKEAPVGMTRRQIIQVLIDNLEAMPILDVKVTELDTQCMVAESMEVEGKRPPMLYVKGSYRPTLRGDSELPFLANAVSVDIVNSARAGKLPAFNAALPVPCTNVLPAAITHVIPANSAPAKVVKPATNNPAGKVSVLIWDVIDRLWEAAGKPVDPKIVLGLRKQAMDELELLGVKRTTASNELGNWWKARAAR